MTVYYLYQNMHLGQDPECDAWAQWLLHIGITNGDLYFSKHMYCGDDMLSLINAMYSQLFTGNLTENQHLPDQYFLDCTILNHSQVHDINASILGFEKSEENFTYLSAD